MRFRCALSLLLAAGCSGPAAPRPAEPAQASAEPEPKSATGLAIVESFIGNVPVKHSAEVRAGDVEISIVGYSGTDYGELGRRARAAPGANGRIRVALEHLTNAADPVEPRHRKCTFVVDCDQPAVVGVADQASAKLGERPGASALAAFVDSYVTRKSLDRGEDLPSQTALSRSGDCTEHALLFVALARRFEHPARDVEGYVLISPQGQLPRQAFGHAWAEVHDGKRWRRVDPSLGVGLSSEERDPTTAVVALPIDEAGRTRPFELRYVPLRVRREEGPGYERDAGQGLTGLHIDALWWHAPGP